MKTKASGQGVVIPQTFFAGVEEVEIRCKDDTIGSTPINHDVATLQGGTQPIENNSADGARHYDHFIYR